MPITTTKIFRISRKKSPWVLIGGAGHVEGLICLQEFIEGRKTDFPNIESEQATLLLIDREQKAWWMSGHKVPVLVSDRFAIGTGGEIAMGAMYAGKSAYEAVEIACQLDINSGDGIDVLKFE